jgi:hypothetical protein
VSDCGSPIDDLPIVGVDVLHPLKQVDTPGSRIVFNEVNRRVVPPDDRIGLVAEVPRNPNTSR